MATVTISHHPGLTIASAMDMFRSHFAGKYDILNAPWYSRLLLEGASRDFFVKKNSWVGVGVKLQQELNRTTFVFTGLFPTVFGAITVWGTLGIIGYLFARPRFREMEAEIQSFIENAAAFK